MFGLTENETIKLLAILIANEESLDAIHEAVENRRLEFVHIFHGKPWGSERDLVSTLFETHLFYTFEEYEQLEFGEDALIPKENYIETPFGYVVLPMC